MEPNTYFEFVLPENPLPARLQNHRLRNEFTDMTIKVGEEQFRAHKLVLTDSSPVMKALLSEKWSTDQVYELSEEFVDPSIVPDLLDYLYCGRIILTLENAHSVCIAADFLDLPELLSASEMFLSKNIDSESVLDLFFFADKLQLEILRNSCIENLFDCYANVLNDSTVLSFSAEQLKLIIEEMNSKCHQGNYLKYKEYMFEAVVKWTEPNTVERLSFLPSMLKAIPLYDLPIEFLREVVAIQSIVANSSACSQLVVDALSDTSESKPKTFQVPNKVYCFGGRDEFDYEEFVRRVSYLDLTSGKWTTSAPLSPGRTHFGGVVTGNKVYLCGGEAFRGNLNIMEVYDFQTNSYSQLQPMPRPGGVCTAALMNNFIYVIGNYSDDSEGYWSTELLRYCIKNNEWKTMKSFNTKRCGHQLVSLRGRLYVISGHSMKSVEQYNPDTDQWTKMASTHYEHRWAAATSHNGKIYIHCYYGSEEYSPGSNTWRTLKPAINSDRSCLLSIRDKLWLLGGNKSQRSIYEFDFDTEQWTLLANRLDQKREYFCAFAVNC